MSEKRDYYEVLGIQKGATEAEIKKAHKSSPASIIPILTPTIRKAPRKR